MIEMTKRGKTGFLVSRCRYEARGRELAVALVKAGLSQKDFALTIGYTPSSVSLVINRRRKATTEFIAQTLQVLPGYSREDLFELPDVR